MAATSAVAAAAGIGVFATGGLGGVHREAAQTFDESADLVTLARTPIVVVCAGVKSILDVGATLERLETLGVAVVGYRTRRFPGFYLTDSGFDLDWSLDSPAAGRGRAARPATRTAVHSGALLVANPLPADEQLDPALHDRTLAEGLAALDARRHHRQGRHAVPAGALPLGHRGREPGGQRPDHPAQRRAGRADRGRPRWPAAPPSRHDRARIGSSSSATSSPTCWPCIRDRSRSARTPRRAISVAGGGQAANTAAWLAAHAGWPVTLVGAVGDDPAGGTGSPSWRAAGVDCAVERVRTGAPTGSVIVLAAGRASARCSPTGAPTCCSTPADVDRGPGGGARRPGTCTCPATAARRGSRPAGRRALAAARDRGLTTSVDAASAAPLRRVGAAPSWPGYAASTCCWLNADEATVLAGRADPAEQARALTADGPAGGGEARRRRRGLGGPHRARSCVGPGRPGGRWSTSTGAGDAFAAGLLAAWCAGADPDRGAEPRRRPGRAGRLHRRGSATGVAAVTRPPGTARQ